MSFRTRLTLGAAIAVAAAVAAASAITYVVVRGELRGQVDTGLKSRAATTHLFLRFDPGTGQPVIASPPTYLGRSPGYVQLIGPHGPPIRPENEDVALPVSRRDRAVASGGDPVLEDAHAAGTHLRVYTVPAQQAGYAIQIALTLEDVDRALARVRRLLLFISLGGIGLAAALGLLVARTALAPVRRLTRAAVDVTETRDLSRRIDARGQDELSRLAATFNTMLAALEESARAQLQLVADASHELRTPLTSLRTNIDVLSRTDSLPEGERESLLRDVREQLVEMSDLVAELVELARGHQPPAAPEEVRLDALMDEAIGRTRRNRPGLELTADVEETWVWGDPSTIERALANLLDNAAKWSPPGGEIEVRVRDGEVTVRDHGAGIDEADLPFVFDRFYRAASARGMPGSGLGLAIVRQVAEAHGGTVEAERAPGGGTLMRLRLPVLRSAAPVA